MSASDTFTGSKYDVFISYAHADSAAVKTLAAALKESGLRIWFDEAEIQTFAAISERIAFGLTQSKAFLAYYSKVYPTRRGCQYELTAAFVAAQTAERGFERLLVVNPEAAESHIQPIQLRDRKFVSAPATPEQFAVTLSDLGKPEEALPVLQSAAVALASVVGPDNPTTLSVLHNIANALIETGQMEEGRALGEKVLESRERVIGIAHADTLSTLELCVFAGVRYGRQEPERKFESKAVVALKELSSSLDRKDPRTTWCAWILYRMWQDDPKKQTEVSDLADKYLAWLITARPQDLEPPQPTIQLEFAGTGNNLFRFVTSRLFPRSTTRGG